MPTVQRSLKHRVSLPSLAALCALALAAGACKEEEPIPLFDEEGTWFLKLFDIEGTGLTNFDVSQRENQFLIHFNKEAQVVASAGCIDSMGQTDITETLCDTDTFQCRCFNYEFKETVMTWTEFTPKGGVKTPDPPMDSTAPKVGETYSISVESYPESGQTYRYSTLPYGLFNSDGETSRYVFQTFGDPAFVATGCLDYCGIAAAPAEDP